MVRYGVQNTGEILLHFGITSVNRFAVEKRNIPLKIFSCFGDGTAADNDSEDYQFAFTSQTMMERFSEPYNYLIEATR